MIMIFLSYSLVKIDIDLLMSFLNILLDMPNSLLDMYVGVSFPNNLLRFSDK